MKPSDALLMTILGNELGVERLPRTADDNINGLQSEIKGWDYHYEYWDCRGCYFICCQIPICLGL